MGTGESQALTRVAGGMWGGSVLTPLGRLELLGGAGMGRFYTCVVPGSSGDLYRCLRPFCTFSDQLGYPITAPG